MAHVLDEQSLIEVPTLRSLLTPRDSPFEEDNYRGGGFVSDEDRVLIHSVFRLDPAQVMQSEPSMARSQSFTVRPDSEAHHNTHDLPVGDYALRSGPRKLIYFNPSEVMAAIVTVGGVVPGTNDVIRSIVYKLLDYGVPEDHILGIQYGFRGFTDREHKPVILTRESVQDIHLDGGTVLGTGTERADVAEIVKKLDLWKVDHLYVIGGHGGLAVADAIAQACFKHSVPTSIVAVPKTIDNDVVLQDRCFGFDSAIEEAQAPLLAAQVEAVSGYRGIGVVKLVGRRAGFIAVHASMASGLVDACLIPEVPFELEGPKGLYAYLEDVLQTKGYAVVCVADGAGRGRSDLKREPGPNGALVTEDVGPWLRSKLKKNLRDVDVKYIDPSYIIRSIPARSQDRVFCRMLAHGAVHGAFAGYTGFAVGVINTHYCLVPIDLLKGVRTVDPHGELWARLRAANGQPSFQA